MPDRLDLHVSYVDPDLYEDLRRYTFETRRTKKEIVEAALREYLHRHPWEKQKGGSS